MGSQCRRRDDGGADKDRAIASGEKLGLEQWGLKDGGVEQRSGAEGAVVTIIREGEEGRHPDTLLLDVGQGQAEAEGESQPATPFLADVLGPTEVRCGEVGEDVHHQLPAVQVEELPASGDDSLHSLPTSPHHLELIRFLEELVKQQKNTEFALLKS